MIRLPKLRSHGFLGLLSALAVAMLWCPWLGRSLWLDELQTAWVVQGTLQEAIARALHTQGFSPFYYVLLWALPVQHSEWLLRLPSVLCCALTCLFLFRIARRFLEPRDAWTAMLVFACLDETIEMAVNARPYALAQLCAVASTYLFIRWVRDGIKLYAIPYALTYLCCVYSNFLFGGVALIQLLFWMLYRAELKLRVQNLVTGLIYIPIGFVPVLPQVQSMLEKREVMAIGAMPAWYDPFLAMFPWLAVIVLVLAVLLAKALSGALPGSPEEQLLPRKRPFDRRPWIFFLGWTLLPPFLVVASSWTLGASLYVPRYYAWAAPGVALSSVMLISRYADGASRLLFPFVLVALSTGLEHTKPRELENWRSAVSAAEGLRRDSAGPLLLYTGVIESSKTEWLADPVKYGQFVCPVLYYPVQDPWLLLPFSFEDEAARQYWKAQVVEKIKGKSSVVVLALNNLHWTDPEGQRRDIVDELRFRLEQEGFRSQSEAPYGRVWVMLFSRQSSENLSVIPGKA